MQYNKKIGITRIELERLTAEHDTCKTCYEPWNGCILNEVNQDCRYSVLTKLIEMTE